MNVSDSKAVHILAAKVKASVENLENVSLSASTLRRRRLAHRSDDTSTFTIDGPLVLHFDGKILPALLGSQKEERIAVVVTGDGSEKLLSVPKVDGGTGILIAAAVFSSVTNLNLGDKIVGLGFDTPSVLDG